MDSDSADIALLRSISLDTVGARNRQYTGRVLPQAEKQSAATTVKRDG